VAITITDPALVAPLKFARINCASGDTTVVAAVSGKKIRVSGITFSCSAAVGVSFKSASTVLVGPMPFDTNGGLDAFRGTGAAFIETAVSEAFVMNLSTTSSVQGSVVYQEVS
jgi:hypothetical protein